MTIQDIIAKVDELTPNQYSTEQKIGWLSTLDGKIYHEIIRTHAGADRIYYPIEGYDSDDYELIVRPPYADDLYVSYLQSRIAAENNEITKYGQFSALFNQAFADFSSWYNRSHRPFTFGRWRM
jgi:hypothetical protein